MARTVVAPVVATAMVLLLVVWPIVALAIEVVLLLVILVGTVAGRVVMRRPWTIVAGSELTDPARRHTWHVVGWRRSARLIDEVATALVRGAEIPAGAQAEGAAPRPVTQPSDRPA